jgi:tetratricopeptide (TPR) repeat protein
LSTTTGTETTLEPGVFAIAAVAMSARQKARGLFGRLVKRLRRSAPDDAWMLPNGATAEQVGERRSDLILVWSDGAEALDETRLQNRWPGATRERLGERLFLVGGVELAQPASPAATTAAPPKSPAPLPSRAAPTPQVPVRPAPPPMATGNPRQQAQQFLALARQSGDRRREANALLDLGVVCNRTGDPRSAAGHLQEALNLARELGDRALESDAQGNLGLALLPLGHPAQALQLIVEAVATARASGNVYQLKQALDNIGSAYGGMRQPERALEAYGEALALARQLGDRAHEADLLWCSAIQHADLDDRQQTLAHGQAAIDICRDLGNPYADMLAEHLAKYAAGEDTLPAQPANVEPSSQGVVVGGWASAPSGPSAPRGPGPLRMAFTAFKSFAKFLGGGLKTLPQAQRDQRLAVCGTCEHHTGVRCRVCGCFTSVKTWLPHERCPIGKW